MKHLPGRFLNALKKISSCDSTIQKPLSPYNLFDQLLFNMKEKKVCKLLDVGANSGQFALQLLDKYPEVEIISFEPLMESHKQLLNTAAAYPTWKVYRRCALGRENRSGEINVAANEGQSSSLKEMNPQFLQHAPHADFIAKEAIDIVTLDSISDSLGIDDSRIALKLDVQGSEKEVLEGASNTLAHVDVLLTEMALMESYVGQDLLVELYQYIEKLGFECYGLYPAYSSDQFRMLEVDGLFLRSRN